MKNKILYMVGVYFFILVFTDFIIHYYSR